MHALDCSANAHLICVNYAAHRELSPGGAACRQAKRSGMDRRESGRDNAGRLLVLETARAIDVGVPLRYVRIFHSSSFLCGNPERVLDRAIRFMARGTYRCQLLSYWYRHERGARIYDDDEVHKTVVARSGCEVRSGSIDRRAHFSVSFSIFHL